MRIWAHARGKVKKKYWSPVIGRGFVGGLPFRRVFFASGDCNYIAKIKLLRVTYKYCSSSDPILFNRTAVLIASLELNKIKYEKKTTTIVCINVMGMAHSLWPLVSYETFFSVHYIVKRLKFCLIFILKLNRLQKTQIQFLSQLFYLFT